MVAGKKQGLPNCCPGQDCLIYDHFPPKRAVRVGERKCLDAGHNEASGRMSLQIGLGVGGEKAACQALRSRTGWAVYYVVVHLNCLSFQKERKKVIKWLE